MDREDQLSLAADRWMRRFLEWFYRELEPIEIERRKEAVVQSMTTWMVTRILEEDLKASTTAESLMEIDQNLTAAEAIRPLPGIVAFFWSKVTSGEIQDGWDLELIRGVSFVHLRQMKNR